MSVTIVPTPANVKPADELRIRALTVKTANGVTDRDGFMGANLTPAGTISVDAMAGVYCEDAWVYDLQNCRIYDVMAWLTDLAQEQHPLAAEAAQRFIRTNDDLKWLAALRLSQDGVCEEPEAGV